MIGLKNWNQKDIILVNNEFGANIEKDGKKYYQDSLLSAMLKRNESKEIKPPIVTGKLNYIMEKMFGIQGYKTLQAEIDKNGMKEGTEVLVKTLTSLHDEFSIGRNVNMDQLASLKYQEKLVKSLAESFDETFGKTVESYDGSSAHILGKEDNVDGSFKRAVAVIDLAKVSDKEYFIRDLEENITRFLRWPMTP